MIKTGADICKITRIRRALKSGAFKLSVFTGSEQKYCESRPNPYESYAGVYAAKEAFFKAAGGGIIKSLFLNVEITHSSGGAPEYVLSGGAAELLKGAEAGLSISHDGAYALAFCALSPAGETLIPLQNSAEEAAFKLYALKSKATEITEELCALPPRPRSTHKGSYGKAVIIGGSDNYPGSVLLAAAGAEAALRAGAGLCVLAAPDCLKAAYCARVLESTLCLLPSENGKLKYDGAALNALTEGAAAVAVGMGGGKNYAELYKIICCLLEKELALIIDADGLNALAAHGDFIQRLRAARARVVLTPHIGEFSRLSGLTAEEINIDPVKHAKDFSLKTGAVLALKSAYTVVTDGAQSAVSFSGSPAQAKGGSGDVLAGAIAGLAAQNRLPLFNSVCAAVYQSGRAGERAAAELGENSVLASDVAKRISF